MLLQIFFGANERLGDVVDEISKHCTIASTNLPTAPISKEPDGTWYFSLDVSLSVDQFGEVIKNSKQNLNVVSGLNDTFQSFLVLNEKEKKYEAWSIFVLEFRDGEMTMIANQFSEWKILEK